MGSHPQDCPPKVVYTSRPEGWPRDSCLLEAVVISIQSLNLRDRIPLYMRHLIVWNGSNVVKGAEARSQWLALSKPSASADLGSV